MHGSLPSLVVVGWDERLGCVGRPRLGLFDIRFISAGAHESFRYPPRLASVRGSPWPHRPYRPRFRPRGSPRIGSAITAAGRCVSHSAHVLGGCSPHARRLLRHQMQQMQRAAMRSSCARRSPELAMNGFMLCIEKLLLPSLAFLRASASAFSWRGVSRSSRAISCACSRSSCSSSARS